MGILGNRVHNLVEILGKQLIPVLAPLFAGLGNGVMALQRFAENHGTLTRVIMVSLAVIAALLFIMGGLATAIGVIGLGFPAVVTGVGLISGVFAAATAATWAFTTALLANPLTWITVGIVALCGGLIWLYNNFEAVEKVVDGFAFGLGLLLGLIVKAITHIPAIAGTIGGALRSVFTGLLGAIPAIFSGLYTSGQQIISTLVSGISSMAAAPVNAIKGIFAQIRNMLPFSDAKEGPLSSLTLSGAKIMDTLGVGIVGAAPGLRRTMQTALTGVALTTAMTVTPAIAAIPDMYRNMTIDPAISAVPGKTTPTQTVNQAKPESDGRKVIIQNQNLYITLPNVSDGKSFMQQLQALVEGFDVN
jgi:hypothetical protein